MEYIADFLASFSVFDFYVWFSIFYLCVCLFIPLSIASLTWTVCTCCFERKKCNPKSIGVKYLLIVWWGWGQDSPCLCFTSFLVKSSFFYWNFSYLSWLRQYLWYLFYQSGVIIMWTRALLTEFCVAWPVPPPPNTTRVKQNFANFQNLWLIKI